MNRVEPGRAQPLLKVLPGAVDPLRLFSALSDEGRAPRAFLLESADVLSGTAEKSLGCGAPCLRVQGRGRQWSMEALERTGEKVLAALQPALGFAAAEEQEAGAVGPRRLVGRLPDARRDLEERARLREPGPIDLLRALHGAFRPSGGEGFPPGGLFGAFAYDFVDHFEDLPQAQEDPLPVPDFDFVFADHLFLIDHLRDRTVLVATALGVERSEEEYQRAQDWIRRYEAAATSAPELPALPALEPLDPAAVQIDLDDEAYAGVVARLKEHILDGDVFQIVPSRSFEAPLREAPLAVYRRLRALNPSPYMFFLRMGQRTLLGASPEMALAVSAGERRVSLRPIAGTRPRGMRQGAVDADLDARYEAELKLDAKELAEHMMLVDLGRNDVARVSRAGTRRVDRLLAIEKYSHVQHLVSEVSGVLRDDLDPLHAYLATMNMGTLTGAPKVEAMRLLREIERTRRGFYGGAAGYYLLDGELGTTIVIRSLLIEDGRAVARAGAGVVHDSVPEREAEETRHKARAPLAALGVRADGEGT